MSLGQISTFLGFARIASASAKCSFLYHSTSVLHTGAHTAQRCRDEMNNSSYVGYGHWDDERPGAAVKKDSSLNVKHCAEYGETATQLIDAP